MQLLFTQQTGEKTNFERLFYENFAFHRFLLQSESQESKQLLWVFLQQQFGFNSFYRSGNYCGNFEEVKNN